MYFVSVNLAYGHEHAIRSSMFDVCDRHCTSSDLFAKVEEEEKR
jgi:hypothetical protein